MSLDKYCVETNDWKTLFLSPFSKSQLKIKLFIDKLTQKKVFFCPHSVMIQGFSSRLYQMLSHFVEYVRLHSWWWWFVNVGKKKWESGKDKNNGRKRSPHVSEKNKSSSWAFECEKGGGHVRGVDTCHIFEGCAFGKIVVINFLMPVEKWDLKYSYSHPFSSLFPSLTCFFSPLGLVKTWDFIFITRIADRGQK